VVEEICPSLRKMMMVRSTMKMLRRIRRKRRQQKARRTIRYTGKIN
jgi:hypothetical protein